MVLNLPESINLLRKNAKRIRRLAGASHLFREQGDLHRDAGQFVQAAMAYSIYLKQAKGDFDIWVQNGNCLKEAGYLVQAENAYKAAFALRSDDADLYLQMGHLAKLMGNPTEALRAYSKSFELLQSQDAADEIENINNSLLNDKTQKEDVLIPELSDKDDSLKTEAAIIYYSVPALQNRVPIKAITPLPANIRVPNRDYELSRQVKEVSLLITKQSVISLGEG